MDARIAVLASGAGSNVSALLDDPHVGPSVALVVSDRAACGALDRARARGVRAVALERGHYGSREDFDLALEGLLEQEGRVVQAFRDRILNVHPSLLPAFSGAHAVRDALDWGARVTGATVHLVDEEVDHGPIVLQEPVAILPGDDEETLHDRVKEVEHRLFPRAAALLADGKLKIEGRRVHILDQTVDGP